MNLDDPIRFAAAVIIGIIAFGIFLLRTRSLDGTSWETVVRRLLRTGSALMLAALLLLMRWIAEKGPDLDQLTDSKLGLAIAIGFSVGLPMCAAGMVLLGSAAASLIQRHEELEMLLSRVQAREGISNRE